MSTSHPPYHELEHSVPFFWRLAVGLMVCVIGLICAAAVWVFRTEAPGLAAHVGKEIAQSGVSNPVTAVLLNFRGYDTLLETGVLLMAVFGVWSVAHASPRSSEFADDETPAMLSSLIRILVPLMILVGGYLLWAGAFAPGGAFQAGAILGAAVLLLHFGGWSLPSGIYGFPGRICLMLGFAVFLFVACAVMPITGYFLKYPYLWAGAMQLMIESALAISIALILATLVTGDQIDTGKKP